MTTYLTIAAISYLLGSIPFGYILVRLFLKQDIRQTGSGNIGATNVARSGAKGLAIATLLLDAAKGFVAVAWIPSVIAMDFTSETARCVAALFAIIGHCFPVWLRFKGGKGVATAAGAFLAFAPPVVAIVFAVFLVTVGTFKYVSLGSIVAAALFPPVLYFWFQSQRFYFGGRIGFTCIVLSSGVVILKHHANIRRLIAGTEPKLGAKPNVPPPQGMEKQA